MPHRVEARKAPDSKALFHALETPAYDLARMRGRLMLRRGSVRVSMPRTRARSEPLPRLTVSGWLSANDRRMAAPR